MTEKEIDEKQAEQEKERREYFTAAELQHLANIGRMAFYHQIMGQSLEGEKIYEAARYFARALYDLRKAQGIKAGAIEREKDGE